MWRATADVLTVVMKEKEEHMCVLVFYCSETKKGMLNLQIAFTCVAGTRRNRVYLAPVEPKRTHKLRTFSEKVHKCKKAHKCEPFIWLSKNRFTIVVLVENRFINHKRVHIYEPFLTDFK